MASFSAKTKNELARVLPQKRCCQLAELAALVRMDGTIRLSADQDVAVVIVTENAAVARKIFKLGKTLFDLQASISTHRNTRLKKANLYSIELPAQPGMAEALATLGVELGPEGRLMLRRPETISRQCCRRAYLRGAFLGGGSLNSPEGTYHLEIITRDFFHSQLICELMRHFRLQPKESRRKRWHVVYLKESEQIVDFLNIIGAHSALLDFENVRVYKGMRNAVNRLVNCETANLNKTVDAGMRQLENIALIRDAMGLEKLPRTLKAVAELRLMYPDSSLKELGEMLDPKLGKSGVNHRLRRLEEIADRLRIAAGGSHEKS